MKRYRLFFALVKVIGEFSLVFACFFLAREIRLVTDLIPRVQLPIQKISPGALAAFALFGAILFVGVFALRGMYRIVEKSGEENTVSRVVSGAFSWFLYYIAVIYLSMGFVFQAEIPRLIIFFTLILSIILVSVFRLSLGFINRVLLQKGILPKQRILILAKSDNDALSEIRNNPVYEIVAEFSGESGGEDEIYSMLREHRVDEILSLDSSFSPAILEECFSLARIYGIAYRYSDAFLFSEPFKTDISFLSGVPVVEIVSIGLTPWGRIVKRTFDIMVSSVMILALSPFLLIVALIIFLSDFHAPVYRSVRIGKLGKPFFMYKFRSMYPDADKRRAELLVQNERVGPLFKIEKDPRITPIGRFIRRFDIDELPQLFNVFLGNMSLVGPRPHLPDEVANYEESQKRVLTLKPGITGMAQVNGRHHNSFVDEVRLDVFYIENWNLVFDFKILLKTISVVFERGFR